MRFDEALGLFVDLAWITAARFDGLADHHADGAGLLQQAAARASSSQRCAQPE